MKRIMPKNKKKLLKEVAAIENQVATVPKKKKKKSKVKKFLKGALNIAGDVAPIALPLAMSLLASHGNNPGTIGSRNIQRLSAVAPNPAAVSIPLNSNISSSNMSPGIMQQTEKRDAFGKIYSSDIVGQEYVGDLGWSTTNNAGDVLFSMQISPLIGALLGTRLSNIAASFGRFKLNNCSIVFQSSLAATQGGQFVACILSDPQTTVPLTGGADAVVRLLGDSAGSDVFQVWSNGVALYPGSVNTDPYYTNPLASDEYLTSAGQVVVAAMSAAPASDLNCGSLFFYYDITFLQPTLETFATITKRVQIAGGTGSSSCTDTSLLGAAVAPIINLTYGDTVGIQDLTGTGFALPVGHWTLEWVIISSGAITSALGTWVTNNIANGWDIDAFYSPPVAGAGANGVLTCTLAPLDGSATGTLPLSFNVGYTGVSSDTINTNFVNIFSDPFSFPAASFSRPRRDLEAINKASQDASKGILLLQKERQLMQRIERMEAALRPPPQTCLTSF